MKKRVWHNMEFIWCVYLILYLFAFVIMRCFSSGGEVTLDQMYTDLYLEGNVIGLYVLLFCFFLIPICNMWRMDIVAVRCQSVISYMGIILRNVLVRSVTFSMVLNIGFYLIKGTAAADWRAWDNVRYILIQTLLQSIGWIEIGILFALIFSYTGNVVWTFLIDYLIFLAFNSSVFAPRNEQFSHYTRLYYMMFHIDVLSSYAEIVSVTTMNIAIILVMIAVLYKKVLMMEYISKLN